MNWPVRLSHDAEAEVAAANHPTIRSFTGSFLPAVVSQKLPLPAQWKRCTPEFARNFTGVGYFFAPGDLRTEARALRLGLEPAGEPLQQGRVAGDYVSNR
jgi:hypothetical protein